MKWQASRRRLTAKPLGLASAPLLVISEMDKVKPGFGKKIAESVEKLVRAKESNPKADPVGLELFRRLLMALTQKGGITPTLH